MRRIPARLGAQKVPRRHTALILCAEALALANELRSRILAGEDFADLARTYK